MLLRTLLVDRRLPVFLLPVVIAGCGGASGGEHEPTKAAPMSLTVGIEDFKFRPAETSVEVGATITFTNRDEAPHTAESAVFDTGRLDKGDSKRVKLDKPGTYEYFCDFHRFMTARVTVTD